MGGRTSLIVLRGGNLIDVGFGSGDSGRLCWTIFPLRGTSILALRVTTEGGRSRHYQPRAAIQRPSYLDPKQARRRSGRVKKDLHKTQIARRSLSPQILKLWSIKSFTNKGYSRARSRWRCRSLPPSFMEIALFASPSVLFVWVASVFMNNEGAHFAVLHADGTIGKVHMDQIPYVPGISFPDEDTIVLRAQFHFSMSTISTHQTIRASYLLSAQQSRI